MPLAPPPHSVHAAPQLALTRMPHQHAAAGPAAGSLSSVPDADTELLMQLLQMASAAAPRMQARAVANCIWSAATCMERLWGRGTPAGQGSSSSSASGPLHASPTWQAAPAGLRVGHGSQHALAGITPDPRVTWLPVGLQHLERLLQRAAAVAGHFEAQHVSSVLYALVKARGLAPAPAPAPATAAGGNGSASAATTTSPQPQPLRVGDSLLPALLARAAGLMEARAFGEQALSNTLYALACLRHAPDDAWMLASVHALAACMETMQPQHVSNVLWAYAKLDYYPGDDAITALLASAESKLPAFTPQALCNTLWALATLQYVPPAVSGQAGSGAVAAEGALAQLVQRLMRVALAGMLSAQDVSNALWAAARLEQASRGELPNGTDGLVVAVQTLQYSGGTAGGRAAPPAEERMYGRLAATLVQASTLQLHAYSPQALANSAWAVSALRLTPPPDWALALAQASCARMGSFKGRELAALALAVAKLNLQVRVCP